MVGQDHDELKLVSHGKRMSKFGLPDKRIEEAVELSGLSGLVGCSYQMTDKGSLLTFVVNGHSF